MTNWLITGGFGFIGSSLAKELVLKSDNNVKIFDNLSVGSIDSLGFEVPKSSSKFGGIKWQKKEYIIGDIRNYEDLEGATLGADVVVHLAANTGVQPSIVSPRLDCESNVLGTLNVLEACRKNKVPRLIFASSGAPLGGQMPPLNEEMAAKPLSPYGASKLAGEGYCQAYAYTFGITTVILRFGNVYGPGSHRKNSVVAKFFKKALAGLPIEIYGDGYQTRDYIYLNDLVNAIISAEAAVLSGANIYQIATSKETSILELVDQIKITLKKQLDIDLKVIHTAPKSGDAPKNYSNTSKAKRELGWAPQTDLSFGLTQTLADLNKERK